MSVDHEREIVRTLRSTGMTLNEIASELGRSASWVNARLSDKYAPKRTRATAQVPPEPLDDAPVDPALAAEVGDVRALRTSGMTYQQIATRLRRSIYWVHTRLRGRYRPRKTRAEMLFQETAVVALVSGTWPRGNGTMPPGYLRRLRS